MIASIRDLEELAPPCVERITEEILGDRFDGEDESRLIIRLKQFASGRGLRCWKETQPDGEGQGRMSRERFEDLRRFYDASFDELVDEINLVIERLDA